MEHRFVNEIPESLEEDILYVSTKYATALHKCCCGCGSEVVTPLSPTDWELSFNGETISLSPSIGNWSFKCQSHYWIKRGKVRWCGSWTSEEVKEGRSEDSKNKEEHFKTKKKKRGLWSYFFG